VTYLFLLLEGAPFSHRCLQEDYRLIVPNVRGFGGSTQPGDVQSSGTLFDAVGDMLCILEHANIAQAVVIGQVGSPVPRSSCLLTRRLTFSGNSHDWGSQIAYEAARERPDVFTAVVSISGPYVAATGPYTPITTLVQFVPKFAYQVYFAEETSTAITELNTDIRRTLRATLRTVASPPPSGFLASNSSYLDAWKNVSTVGLEMMSVMSPGPQCGYLSRYRQSRSSVRLRRIIGLTSTISRSSISVSIPLFLSDAVCSVAHKLQTLSSIPTLCVHFHVNSSCFADTRKYRTALQRTPLQIVKEMQLSLSQF
jgi:pimeloyl-ACP methyl ester carboxylesterase